MATDYEPDAETAAFYARFKRTHIAYKEMLKQVKDGAPDEMRKGATVGQLSALTGLTDEVFRRIGRAHNIDRLREPTVGKDAKPKTKED